MRAFLAIELSEEVKTEILRIKEILERSGLLKAKYVGGEHMHLTLKFFGEILDREAGMIADVLRGISFPSFSCCLGGLGFFSDRILWIDLEDGGEIKRLHDLTDEKLGDFFDPDTRFHNHVTFARIKRVQDHKRLQELIEQIHVRPVQFLVDEYVLKKSELKPEGPMYEDVYRFPLR